MEEQDFLNRDNYAFARLAEIEKPRPLTETEKQTYENSLKCYRDNVNIIETACKKGRIKAFVDNLSMFIDKNINETSRIVLDSNGLQQHIQEKFACSKTLVISTLMQLRDEEG